MKKAKSDTKVYVFDTSAILECWVRSYPPDVFPGLYDFLSAEIEEGKLVAPDEVLYEIGKKDDDVLAWGKKNRTMFLPLDEEIQMAAVDILEDFPRLVEAGGKRSVADPFVIALAKVKDGIVVTMEKNIATERRIRIPRVCDELKIKWCSVVQYFRLVGVKFGS